MIKKKRGILLSSFAAGVFLLGFLVRGAITPAQHIEKQISPPALAESAAVPAESIAASAWQKDAVYVGGDTVRYDGKIYRAKWWTQGELPDASDVWENTGEAAAPQTAVSPPAAPPAAQPAVNQTGTSAGFKVVGYYPSWKPGETAKLRWDVLTHAVYAFAIPTADGGLRPLENAETAQSIIASAHQNGRKVLLAIGGWSYNDVPLEPVFVSATATEDRRKAFADAMISMCDQYGFDGIDMDWEHPRVDGGSAAQYEALMVDLAARLHAKGKILTSAVLSGATPDGGVYYDAAAHSDKVLAAVDWLHVMAYDGGDGERHSPYAFAVASGQYWKNTRGLPASKVVLGVPFYGRPSWASYEDILKANPQAWNTDVSIINGMQAHYNGMATVEQKTRFAYDALGGVMMWEVSQDTANQAYSLLTAIARGMGTP